MSAPKHRKAQPRHILATQVAQLHAEGLRAPEIAERLRISRAYAYELLNDPQGHKQRARKAARRGTCVACGGPTSYARGGFSELCMACSRDNQTIWTHDAIICAIQEWVEEHGGIPPRSNDWRKPSSARGPWPSLQTVQNKFGSWSKAIRAAGFEPHPIGPVGGWTPLTQAQREECALRYSAGESSTSIAADLGCGYMAVLKWAREANVPIREPRKRKAA